MPGARALSRAGRGGHATRGRTCDNFRLAIRSAIPFRSLKENPCIPTMPQNRILATIAIVASVLPWAWSQSGTPDPAAATAPAASTTPPGVSAEAEKVLDAAIAKVSVL